MRLTKREGKDYYYPKCFKEPCFGGGCNDEFCHYEFCKRLGEYEDACYTEGDTEILTPADIAELLRKGYEQLDQLRRENEGLRELVRLAVNDLWRLSDCLVCSTQCGQEPGYKRKCLAGGGHYKWQHADRAAELGVEIDG